MHNIRVFNANFYWHYANLNTIQISKKKKWALAYWTQCKNCKINVHTCVYFYFFWFFIRLWIVYVFGICYCCFIITKNYYVLIIGFFHLLFISLYLNVNHLQYINFAFWIIFLFNSVFCIFFFIFLISSFKCAVGFELIKFKFVKKI